MAQSHNRVELTGRLGADPELRHTGDGTPVANFRLATARPVRAGAPPQTDWHAIVCWERRAEFAAQYLARGRLVFVAGRLTYREYEDNAGTKRTSVEIVATEIVPLDSRATGTPTLANTAAPADGDDVPF